MNGLQTSEWMFAISTLVAPFFCGMLLFSRWVFRDIEVRWGLGFATQCVFAATLAVSFQTHIVILGEVSGALTRQARSALWKLDFTALIVLLKVIIPFLAFWAIVARRSGGSTIVQLFFALILQTIWLMGTNWGGTDLDLQKETERLALFGLACIAVLSGWGSVYGPYSYGPWFIKKYDDSEIARVENKLMSVMEMLATLKRRECTLLFQSARVANEAGIGQKQSPPSFMDRMMGRSGTMSPTAQKQHESIAMQDVKTHAESLSMLSNELFLELTEMRRAKQANLFRKTALGKVYTFLGYTFAVYCILKMIASVYGVVFPKKHNDPDLITRVLSFALLLARDREEANLLAQTISFVMVGVLVFNSFRGLLVSLGRIFHQIGPRDSVLVALLLTEVMGQYLLSSIIILDMNVPLKFRGELFFLRFEFFRVWSDVLFLVAGVSSAALIYAIDRAQRSRTEFYYTTMHEKIT